MNTTTTTIRRGIATIAATAAFFAFAACGSEISAPAQDIGGTKEQKETTPPSPTKTSPTRGNFRDESGQKSGQRKQGKQKSGQSFDPIDRTRDWH